LEETSRITRADDVVTQVELGRTGLSPEQERTLCQHLTTAYLLARVAVRTVHCGTAILQVATEHLLRVLGLDKVYGLHISLPW
jgi:hypothetical protein